MIVLVPLLGIVVGAVLFGLIAGPLLLFGVVLATANYMLLAFICGALGLLIAMGLLTAL